MSANSRVAVTENAPMTAQDFQREIIRLSEATEESKNILIYGDSNAGKTVLAGTLPPRTFWAVGEPGYKAAIRWRKAQGLPPHLGARRISNTAEAWALIEWLNEKKRYRKIDWLVVDGSTTMQDRFRMAYCNEAFRKNPQSRQHHNIPDRPDYFNTQNMLKAWFPLLIDMGVNLLVTAHAYRTDMTENGELLVYPGYQGKVTEVSNAISGLMDITGYLESRQRINPKTKLPEVQRRLWVSSPTGRKRDEAEDTRYIVGDKFMALGDSIINPTMPKIISMIDGEDAN